jgi:hypothetical protein
MSKIVITHGIYQTRNGTLVGVNLIRPSGFIEGETRAGKTVWAPHGRWLDAGRDSEMDLVKRVGEFIE